MTVRPRVLHIISSLSTYGAERFVAALVDGLRTEIDVAVMTMYSPRPEIARRFAGRLIDVARQGRGDLGFFGRMVAGIRAFRPDIVHTHVHNGKYWGRLAALVAGVPAIVHTEHNSDFRASFPVRLATTVLHAKTARIIAFSRGHAARIAAAERVPLDRFAVLANGISPHRPALDRAAACEQLGGGERAIVVHVGRLMPVKNQVLAIAAFAASPSLRARARLVLVGDGPDEAALRAAAAEGGVAGDVRFAGYRDDVLDLLPGADVVVLTSRNEAMPLVALEAMFARIPIVTVPWDGSDELFESGRLAAIAPDYEPAHLAQTLLRELEAPDRLRERAELAHAVALKQYTLDAAIVRHVAFYRELTIRSRSGAQRG